MNVPPYKFMVTLPKEFSDTISVFAPLFSKKVFEHAKVLLMGAIVCVKARTVCSALRSVGLQDLKQFHKFHRVLSLSKWSSHKASRVLLDMLLNRFIGKDQTVVFGIDETVERRWGQKIKARGIHRDAVRSSHSHFVKCSGLKWICVMLLVPIHWANRVWALPFLTVLMPSIKYHHSQGKKHKKLTDWARQIIMQLKRWLPDRSIVVVADASYACYKLLDGLPDKVDMITRLRLDARLFDFPPPRPKGKRGPNRIIGQRQPTLKQRLTHRKTKWLELIIPHWYGQKQKTLLVCSGTAIWYKASFAAVPLRWILIKDPEQKRRPMALLCTDLNIDAKKIISYFIRRWTVEVTFEETRKHLGIQTQRQWSDKAILRTTPVLMALFSIITIWADELHRHNCLSLKTYAWYQKSHPTFSDAIASVKIRIWRNQKFLTSLKKGHVHNLKSNWLTHLINMACHAA